MKQYVKEGLIASAALAVLGTATFSAYVWHQQQHESPHYRGNACGVCHQEDGLLLKASELALCTSCHDQEGDVMVRNAEGHMINVNLGNSHPFGIVPSAKSMPRMLPLPGGVITCQTCHDVHQINDANHMVRLCVDSDYTPLCRDCHAGY